MSTFDGLVRAIGEWGERTFPGVTDAAKIAHLRKEVEELSEDPSSGEEMADVLMLLCHLAFRHNVDLEQALLVKFALNKRRRWGAPDANRVVEHIRDVGPR